MPKQKYYYILGVIVLALIIITGFFWKPQNLISENGFLEGKVTIGPLCPVVTKPPNSDCEPTEETYQTWPIAVWKTDKKTKIAQLEPDSNGSYKLELPIGKYIVDLEKQQPLEVGGNNLPASVEINSGQTTYLDLNIDTGIR